jgi:iron complex outermembrane receptor protein
MIFQRKKVASALAYMLGVGGAMSLIAAPAQAADIKVDVTGSNIKRVEGEGALPVQVITREDIERSGSTSVMDIMNFISANNSGGQVSVANTIGASTFSVQTASLRGLGGQNTLILINGKRVTQSSGEVQGVYGVNLDAIPFSAIERVEVLKDGASAVYGSDAVGGVINFIMRQDFTGIEATAYYGAPTRSGGGEITQASITGGWGDLGKDKFNIFGTFYYQKQDRLNAVDRNFADSSVNLQEGLNGVSGNTFPAFVTTGGIGSSLNFPNNCAPSIPQSGRCFYDPNAAPDVNIIPQLTTYSAYGSARYQFNADWQGYLTGGWSKVENNFVIQPTPLSDQILYGPQGDIPASFLLPPSSPYYPTAAAIAAGVNGQPLNVRYRAYGLGLRDQQDTNEQWQGVIGVKGNAWNWDMDFDFAYSHSQTTQTPNGGFARYSDIMPILNSGVINPFGPSSPAAEAQVQAVQFREQAFKGESSGYVFEAKGSRDIYNLPAGPLGMALGAQAGRQELSQTFNPALQAGDVTGYGGNFLNIDAHRNFWSIFGEFNIPIVKTLEATAAVRYDDYSDFGATTNPKFALRWTPIQQLLVRGSWGTSFVAPTLTQAYGAETSGLSSAGEEDPLRCPVTQDTNDCLTQFTVRFGGNPDLKPQTATQWQVGFLLEPTPGVSFGVDYFNIDLKNTFSNGPSVETILADQAQFGYLITRGPVQPQYPNIPGPIANIDQRFINLGETKIQGLDFDARVVLPTTAIGRFVVSLNSTYYIQYDVQQVDGSFAGFISNAYASAVTGVTPRYKQYLALNWNYGPWAATLGNTYISSYIDYNTTADDVTRRVGNQSLWDLYGAYTGFKNWKLVLGVKNLMDTNPPFSNQRNSFQLGYDPTQYDSRARFVYGSVTYSFK